MKEVIEIIEKLRTLSGNAQLDYLREHKDNQILKEVLYYTYNPDLKYNIDKAKLDKASGKVIRTANVDSRDYTVIDKDVWERYKSSLDSLAEKKGVKEADIVSLYTTYFLYCEPLSASLLKGILLKYPLEELMMKVKC